MEAKRIYSGTYKFYIRIEDGIWNEDVRMGDKEIWIDSDRFLHNEYGPAYIQESYEEYYLHGKRHRLDGPAFKANDIEYEEWWIDGVCLSPEKSKLLKIWHERHSYNGT